MSEPYFTPKPKERKKYSLQKEIKLMFRTIILKKQCIIVILEGGDVLNCHKNVTMKKKSHNGPKTDCCCVNSVSEIIV